MLFCFCETVLFFRYCFADLLNHQNFYLLKNMVYLFDIIFSMFVFFSTAKLYAYSTGINYFIFNRNSFCLVIYQLSAAKDKIFSLVQQFYFYGRSTCWYRYPIFQTYKFAWVWLRIPCSGEASFFQVCRLPGIPPTVAQVSQDS